LDTIAKAYYGGRKGELLWSAGPVGPSNFSFLFAMVNIMLRLLFLFHLFSPALVTVQQAGHEEAKAGR
jgi:hypothetical protein